jgi:hypothetical protein
MTAALTPAIRLWALLGILITAAAVHAYDYSFLVPRETLRIESHAAVLAGVADPAQQYRVLVPWVMNRPIAFVARFMPAEIAFRRAYAVFHAVALTLLLASLYGICRFWFTSEQSLAGTLLVGATLRLPLRPGEYWDFSSIPDTSVFSPGSLLDPIFVALALALVRLNRTVLLAAVVVVAALNSEVALLLPLLYLLAGPIDRLRLARSGAYLLLCGSVLVALRIGLGQSDVFAGIATTLGENLAHVPSAVINLTLFLGPVWLLCVLGLRTAPPFVRRAALAAPAYLIAIAIWGYWWDVRNLMPLYPLLLPFALSAMFVPRSAAS